MAEEQGSFDEAVKQDMETVAPASEESKNDASATAELGETAPATEEAKAEESAPAAAEASKAEADTAAEMVPAAAEVVPAVAEAEAEAVPAAAEAVPAVAEPVTASSEDTQLAAAQKRLLELLPGVKDESVLKELASLADSDALEKLVNKGKAPPKASFGYGARPSLKSTGSNIFTQNDTMKKAHDSQEAAEARGKNLGMVNSAALAVGGAGQGGGLGLNKPGFGPKVQHFAGRGSVTGAKSINMEGDVSTAWAEMQDDKSPIGWVVAKYSDDGKTIMLQDKGEGGLSAFKAQLGDNGAWGGFRCYGVDKRGGLECKRPKFVFVCYKPETMSGIKKARQASHKGDVKEVFPGAHVDIIVETMKDLDEQDLITKLQAATGAHKPNGYEFEDGVFLEADYYGLGIGKSCKGESAKN